MSKGGSLQLVAYGEQDLLLTGRPEFTYYKSVYHRHTNFAVETVRQYFSGTTTFGNRVVCKLQRVADLVKDVRLRVSLPALEAPPTYAGDEPYYAGWANSIGHVLIREAILWIGEIKVSYLYGIWLEIWAELTIPYEKRAAYAAMVGKHEYFTYYQNRGALELEIPLPFFFCLNSSLALPLMAIQEMDVQIEISLESFQNCWVSNTPVAPLTVEINAIYLEVDYVYLDMSERQRFISKPQDYLIQQLQLRDYELSPTSTENIFQVDFNHPVSLLTWVIQRSDLITTVGNEWYFFGGNSSPYDGIWIDPITTATLQINGKDRQDEQPAKYYRVIQPYISNDKVPQNLIYMYSFGLKIPGSLTQPNGQCNFTEIDSFRLKVNVIQGMNRPKCVICGLNYNILSVQNGFAQVLYAT